MSQFTNSPFRLDGEDIWVIGGAGYLGQATVKLLLAAGARVLCVDLEDKAATFAASLDDASDLAADTLDIRDEAGMKHFVAARIKSRGIPHGLVILTYGSTAKHFEDLSGEDFDRVNHAGLTATFLLAREVGMEMERAGRGSIVLFSSMYGSVSPDPRVYFRPMNVNPIEYGVGKAGIVQMTKYLAVHWAPKGIRCNCISPGPFPSPAVQKAEAAFVARLAQKVPMGRVGKSEEVAGAAVFLLTAAAGFITGHNLFVDGGWTIW
jgi:NAD(P)-dependent dehydrogenase (short-subunit alcohol dehydrogenase family)